MASHQYGGVAGPRSPNASRNRVPRNLAGLFEDLQNAVAHAVSDVKRLTTQLANTFETKDVGCNDVADVHVIAHTGPILGGIAVAVNDYPIPLAQSHVQDTRDKVTLVGPIFSTPGGSAGSVKIAQTD